jgi:hypothetical protein
MKMPKFNYQQQQNDEPAYLRKSKEKDGII